MICGLWALVLRRPNFFLSPRMPDLAHYCPRGLWPGSLLCARSKKSLASGAFRGHGCGICQINLVRGFSRTAPRCKPTCCDNLPDSLNIFLKFYSRYKNKIEGSKVPSIYLLAAFLDPKLIGDLKIDGVG